MIATGADGIVKFEVATQVSDNCARNTDGITPLHAAIPTVRLIQDVDPRLPEKDKAARQRVIKRQSETRFVKVVAKMIRVRRNLKR